MWHWLDIVFVLDAISCDADVRLLWGQGAGGAGVQPGCSMIMHHGVLQTCDPYA
jgi:hypothetical protein